MDSYRPTKMISKSIQTAVKKIREIWLYTLLFLVSAYIFRAVVDKISDFPQKKNIFCIQSLKLQFPIPMLLMTINTIKVQI